MIENGCDGSWVACVESAPGCPGQSKHAANRIAIKGEEAIKGNY